MQQYYTVLHNIQLIAFTGYILFIVIKFGVLDSISKSWYMLDKQSWMFTIFTWLVGLPMVLYENSFLFFAGAFLVFTGTAAEYKKKMTNTIHFVGAGGSIVLSFIGIIVEGGQGGYLMLALFVFASLGLILIKEVNNKTFWIECIAFYVIIWSIIMMHGRGI